MFGGFCIESIRKKVIEHVKRYAFGLNILNGVCNGDLQGRYTFISHCGNSVNGYFMVSEDLFALIQHDYRLCVMERIESDHIPLELLTNVEEMIKPAAQEDKNECTAKFVWKADCAQQFTESMHSDKSKERCVSPRV